MIRLHPKRVLITNWAHAIIRMLFRARQFYTSMITVIFSEQILLLQEGQDRVIFSMAEKYRRKVLNFKLPMICLHIIKVVIIVCLFLLLILTLTLFSKIHLS